MLDFKINYYYIIYYAPFGHSCGSYIYSHVLGTLGTHLGL